MKIAADFNQRVLVHSQSLEWLRSPMPGVDRKPLDRVGDEVARATTIVRYAPGSAFSAHVHTGGEEFFVLEGVFEDEHGSFPAGSYIRNPPKSQHQPSSSTGCVMLVKLWQFQSEDSTHIRLQTEHMFYVTPADVKGVGIMPLYKDSHEEVSILAFDAYGSISLEARGGAELFVLAGSVNDQSDTLVKHSWLRLPIGSDITITAGNQGAKVWLKTGHLNSVEEQIIRVSGAESVTN